MCSAMFVIVGNKEKGYDYYLCVTYRHLEK